MRWKWLVGAVVFLLVAVIAAAYVILATYDYNKFKPLITKKVKETTGRELTLGGDIKLKIGLLPVLSVDDVQFQNASWGSRPYLAKIKHFDVQVRVLPLFRGKIEIRKVVLIEPDVLIETNKQGKSNLQFKVSKKTQAAPPAEKQAKGAKSLPELRLKKIELKKGKFIYRDGKSGKSYMLSDAHFSATAKSFGSPLRLKLAGVYNKNPFEIKGSLGALIALTDPAKPWPLKLSIKAAKASIAVEGIIKDVMAAHGINISIDAKGDSLPEVGRFAGVSGLPDLGPFAIALKLTDPAAKTYKIDSLQLSAGGSDLKGSAEIRLARKRPRLTARLKSKELDLRPFIAGKESEAKPEATSGKKAEKGKRVFSDEPLPLDVLRTVDANVNLRAARVLLPQLALDNFFLKLVLDNGHLTVKPVKAGIGGGSLVGQVDLRPVGKRANLATKLNIKNLDLGRMLKELGVSEAVSGELKEVQLDVKGAGRSVAELMAGLNGATTFIMKEGKINNKYLGLLGADLTTAAFRLLNPAKDKGDYTAINCVVSRFDIRDGIADTTVLLFDTPQMTVVGAGEINLRNEHLNLALKPSAKKGATHFSVSLSELTKPFKLGGTLGQPALAVDVGQTALTVEGKDLCPVAVRAARQGVKLTEVKATGKQQQEKGEPSKTTDKESDSLGGKLKSLFGK
ncbi:MAG: AsmA family protein [Deltaproteobacteria bacterium]|nr:AsmA family protein [Deltaproteobacteria bacterium]